MLRRAASRISDSQVSLVAVGDLLITRSMKKFISCADASYRSVLSALRRADVTVGNLEVCLTATGFPAEKLVTLRADPSLAPEISETGIDVLTLANNHTMDYGYTGLLETMKTLRKHRIPFVGAGKNIRDAYALFVYRKKRLRISFLSVSTCLALGAEASDLRPGVAPVRVSTAYEIDPTVLQEQPGTPPVVRSMARMEDVQFLTGAIARAKRTSDFVVVAIHWGVAYQDRLAEYQRPLAHAMIRAGADVIVGHHAHVPHAIEVYRRGIVFYGLGNFISRYKSSAKVAGYLESIGIDINRSDASESLFVRLTLRARRKPTCEVFPITIDKEGFPRLADQRTGQKIVERLNQLSSGMARIEFSGGTGHIIAG